MRRIICPYCNNLALLERSKVDGYYEYHWVCKPCDAKIRANHKTKKPKGTLANLELRRKRMEAHRAFDVKWLFTGNRTRAYKELAKHLELSSVECHMANFDIDMCNRVISYSRGE